MAKKLVYIENGFLKQSVIDAEKFISTTTGGTDATKTIQSNGDGRLDYTFLTALNGKIKYATAPTFSDGLELVSKTYVDESVISSGHLKESVLAVEQLSATQGILAAEVVYITTNPVGGEGDEIIISNGTATETWTFVASRVGANEVTIGATVADTMTNLATAISTDSTVWGAKYEGTKLDSMNADGVVIVYEEATAAGASTSRIYTSGALTTAVIKVVEYTAEAEYSTGKVAINIPTSDPAAKRFGFRRQVSALTNGEIHASLAGGSLKEWDADETQWWTLSGDAIPVATAASGGGVIGKATYNSDSGMAVSNGVVSVKVDASTIDFIATEGANKGKLYIPNSGVGSTQLGGTSVTAAKLGSDVAGSGLTGGNGSAIAVDWAAATSDSKAWKASDLISTSVGKGASYIGIYDVADYFTSATVEGALAELGAGNIGISKNTTSNVDVGNPLFISGSDTVAKYTDLATDSYVIGLAAATVTSGNPVRIVPDDKIVSGLSGMTVGARQYWTGTAYTEDFSTFSTNGQHIWQLGVALKTTDLYVDIKFLMVISA